MAIPKGYNPVTLGLFIQGYSYLAQGSGFRTQGPLNENLSSESPFEGYSTIDSPFEGGEGDVISSNAKEYYSNKIQDLITELKALVPSGYHGACWGYDFNWEARYASIPAYQPTVVATGIINNALFTAYKITGNKECAELIKSSAHFVLEDLNKTYSGDSLIFSYSPFDKQQVFNASMKGVRILAQAYSLTGDENLRAQAKRAVQFVVSCQRTDGSWGYSLASQGGWTDNYHTGYILDCLHDYSLLCEDHEFDHSMRSGFEFYSKNFIETDGRPKFYHNEAWPIDCTAAAQTILTLIRFGDIEKAKKVAEFMIGNIQSQSGGFYFRKYKHYTNRTVFMRWSNAWMFAALSFLLNQLSASE